jgi:glycosyltransferase involved in cell wall biosynthesis
VPEVIEHGKTGFIVENTSEMIDTIENIGKIKRRDCRQHVEKNFTLDLMVGHYERVLHSTVYNTPPKTKTFIKGVKFISDKIVDQLR